MISIRYVKQRIVLNIFNPLPSESITVYSGIIHFIASLSIFIFDYGAANGRLELGFKSI